MILVLNCGSQSIKWKLFNSELKLAKECRRDVLAEQGYEKILREEVGKLKSLNISLIGHRVVHGGNLFVRPARITKENMADLEKMNFLAPLHNPYNVLGIKACLAAVPGAPNIAVFDTEFFSGLPEDAVAYALPEEIVKKFGFKRYGFHGISHEYAAKEAARIAKKDFRKTKIISCHLGGGASMAAIKNGKAVDVSMGFTPMEGLVMMTRGGSIDPGIVLELAKEFGAEKTKELLNKESGIKGICGESEFLKVLEKMAEGSEKCRRAFDVFVRSAKKYIGAYFAILGGCDILVFTGAVGAGNPRTRNAVCRGLNFLNKAEILSVQTNEELSIAQKIYEKHSLV